jgi:hypothetical protein
MASLRGNVADIFHEVDEDLRAERAQALFKRYAGLGVLVLVLILAGVGGWQTWRWWQNRQDLAVAGEFLAAMRTADATGPAAAAQRPASIAAFEAVAARSPEGYRTLARLRAAGLKADAGDAAGAATLWDQVSADGSADPLLRDLASLLWVQHQLGSADPAALDVRLGPLLASDNPWRFLAAETQALLLMREGKSDAARDSVRRLSLDPRAPEGIRGRADALLNRLNG